MKRPMQLFSLAILLAGIAAPVLAFPGDGGGADPNYWVRLGAERFEGPRDRETAFGGWAGRSIDRVGLRALDGEARCTAVRAEFGNGHIRDLDTSNLLQMTPGRVYRIDLPGGDRRIVQLHLKCRALGQHAVSVEIFARK